MITIVTAKLKASPSGLSRHTGGCCENDAHHDGRVSESESSDYKISSGSDDSLLTDEGKLSLKPYMDELPATPSTLRKSVEKKNDQSQNPHTTGTLPPSPPTFFTERCESDSFDGKISRRAVLLMTRFFAQLFWLSTSSTKSRETKC